MSGGGGKGGSQETSVTYPPWVVEPAKRAIQRGEDISKIGYIPYEGPDVAALSPQQTAAMEGTQSAAMAFGLPQANPMANLPEAQTYAGGIQGYSAAPVVEQLIDDFRKDRPGQAALYDSLFVDPLNGATPPAPPAPPVEQPGVGMYFGSPQDRPYTGLGDPRPAPTSGGSLQSILRGL